MKIFVAFFVIAGLLASSSSWGQIGTPQRMKKSPPPAWMLTPWTGNETPYRNIEGLLRKQYQQGKNMSLVATQYKREALAHPKDPLAQFSWACAARGSAKIAASDGTTPDDALQAMERVDPKNVHEYTLMRFVITQENQPGTTSLDVVAARLARRDPNSQFIKMPVIYALSWAGKYAEALPIAKNWVRQSPSSDKAHSMLAEVYFDEWQASGRKNQALGNQVVAEYQAYLRLAPPNDGFRKPAQMFVDRVLKEKKP